METRKSRVSHPAPARRTWRNAAYLYDRGRSLTTETSLSKDSRGRNVTPLLSRSWWSTTVCPNPCQDRSRRRRWPKGQSLPGVGHRAPSSPWVRRHEAAPSTPRTSHANTSADSICGVEEPKNMSPELRPRNFRGCDRFVCDAKGGAEPLHPLSEQRRAERISHVAKAGHRADFCY
jgi:hypothetical protein